MTPAMATRVATAQDFVTKCLEEVGDEYEFGAEVDPGTDADETSEWDCSELVQVKLNELGIDAPDGSTAQLRWCEEHGTLIPLEEGIDTFGALLLREGHVAVSLGDGSTVEAMGEAWGVVEGSAEGRTFTHAGLVPGLDYSEDIEAPDDELDSNDSDDADDYVEIPEAEDDDPIRGDAGKLPPLRKGSKGGAVKFLQRKLKGLGKYSGAVDGIFGSVTEAAVEAFQESAGLSRDGRVGSKTWRRSSQFRRGQRKRKTRQSVENKRARRSKRRKKTNETRATTKKPRAKVTDRRSRGRETTNRNKPKGKVIRASGRATNPRSKEKNVSVRLLLTSFRLKEGKWPDKYKGWDMYYLFEIEDPRDANQRIATAVPSKPIEMKDKSRNKHVFGSEGMEVYYGPLPEGSRVNVQVTAIQSKEKTRATGAALKSIAGAADEQFGSQAAAAAASSPWAAAGAVAIKGGNVAGKLLAKTKDKSRGSITLDKSFDTSRFNRKWVYKGSKWSSSKEVKLQWTWIAEVVD